MWWRTTAVGRGATNNGVDATRFDASVSSLLWSLSVELTWSLAEYAFRPMTVVLHRNHAADVARGPVKPVRPRGADLALTSKLVQF